MQKLQESFSMTPELRNLVTSKKAVLNESLLKIFPEKYLNESNKNSEIVLWEMPISRYGVVNANGRIYPRKLWENVIQNQKHIWQGQVGLADHPKENEDGNFKEAACVWLDMRLDEEGLVWGTCTFVGPYGKLAEEILQKGGRIGFSSSGLGDLREDGTVDPDTFIIERPADIVLNPSQNVFGKLENMKKPESGKVTPFLNRKRENIMNNNNEQPISLSEKREKAYAKLEEKRIRKDIERFLADAEKISDPQKKLEEIEEIKTFIDAGFAKDLKPKVLKKIAEQKEEIERLIQSAKDLQETFKVQSPEDIKDGVSLLAAEAKIALSEARDWEQLAIALSKKLKEAYAQMESMPKRSLVERLIKKLKVYSRLVKIKDKQIREFRKSLTEKIREKHNINSERVEQIKKLIRENHRLRQNMLKLKNLNNKLKEVIEKKNEVIRAKEKEMEIRENRIREQLTPKIIPMAKDRLGEVLQINEKDDIEKYFQDLALRHGKSITKYRERFLRCRSLKEATQLYLKVLPLLNEGEEYYENLSLPDPDSVGIGITERKQLVEESGVILDDSSPLLKVMERNGLR